jgi:hypothetical protein
LRQLLDVKQLNSDLEDFGRDRGTAGQPCRAQEAEDIGLPRALLENPDFKQEPA